VEVLVALQQATNESAANRTLQDALKIFTDTSPRLPPKDYYELCIMMGTYVALLCSLFGQRSEFFAAVFNIFNILMLD
jgi:hypothetical protein